MNLDMYAVLTFQVSKQLRGKFFLCGMLVLCQARPFMSAEESRREMLLSM